VACERFSYSLPTYSVTDVTLQVTFTYAKRVFVHTSPVLVLRMSEAAQGRMDDAPYFCHNCNSTISPVLPVSTNVNIVPGMWTFNNIFVRRFGSLITDQ
jgi:hypothetical protein